MTEGRRLDHLLDTVTQNRLQAWVEDEEEEDIVFILDLRDPQMTLHLTKTTIPFTPPSSTHAFCIITSQVRTHDRTCSTPSECSQGFRSSFSQSHPATTPTDTRTSFSTETSRLSTSTEGYFPSEKSGSSSKTRVRMRGGKGTQLSIQHMLSAAEEHWSLLESFDWAKTKLGPSKQWVEAIGPLLSVTFQSKTMDCIWLGDDLQLI